MANRGTETAALKKASWILAGDSRQMPLAACMRCGSTPIRPWLTAPWMNWPSPPTARSWRSTPTRLKPVVRGGGPSELYEFGAVAGLTHPVKNLCSEQSCPTAAFWLMRRAPAKARRALHAALRGRAGVWPSSGGGEHERLGEVYSRRYLGLDGFYLQRLPCPDSSISLASRFSLVSSVLALTVHQQVNLRYEAGWAW